MWIPSLQSWWVTSLSQLANCLKSLLIDQETLSGEWTLFMQKARAFCFLLKTLFNSKAPSIYNILNSTNMNNQFQWMNLSGFMTNECLFFLKLWGLFFFKRKNCFLNAAAWLSQVWNSQSEQQQWRWASLIVSLKACQINVILDAF